MFSTSGEISRDTQCTFYRKKRGKRVSCKVSGFLCRCHLPSAAADLSDQKVSFVSSFLYSESRKVRNRSRMLKDMTVVTLHFVFKVASKGFIKKGLFGTLTLKDIVSPSVVPSFQLSLSISLPL